MKINLQPESKPFDVTNIKDVQRHISALHGWKRARRAKSLDVQVLDDALVIAYAVKQQLQHIATND